MPKKHAESLRGFDANAPKRRIKVLRIIARMNIGGPAVQVTGLMHELDREVFDHKLITGFVEADEADYLVQNNIDLEVTRIKDFGRSINALSDMKAYISLAREVRKFRPDIIHTHTAKAGVLGRTAWIFLGYKPKIMHTFHGHLLHGYFGKIKTSLVIVIEKVLGLITNKFLVVGKQVAKELVAAGIGPESKFENMPPGLSLKVLPQKYEVYKKYNLNPDYFYCVYLGRVTEIKKPHRFLDIAKKMKDLNPKIHFLLVGSGDLSDECNQRIVSEKLPVNCLGWVFDVEEILAITDLMVLTSENEGMPLSLIQAGMAGVPSISTDVGSVSEVIINGETGYYAKFDVNIFAEIILRFAGNPELCAEFGNAAKMHTTNSFSVKRLALDHKKQYLQLFSR